MNHVLKSISYIFHPLLMPLLGVAFYFSKTPRFIPDPVIKAKLFSTAILTIVLPILLFFLLKTLRKVDSIHLKTPKERTLPLFINCIIICLILVRVFTPNEVIELVLFFCWYIILNIGMSLFSCF